ncbi:MAG TPA: hypothetical protein PKX23_04880 [Verrucomicrobiota bacterium]|jgi:O-antigen/teichoic acid export membrane protein|nr:hypothetical protein [Verrucomicrobiota bacterium]HRT08089.1 hypothetical protein [Candidatus Paceibacterota bacterium]HRT57770.1 hypothetical protein [Candidatus Paceibacterota bacterium]
MSAVHAETVAPADAARDAGFFRQSGWLMVANIGGGALMWAVHFLARRIPPGEYGNFGGFLAVIMVLPTIPLQMVLAQQTARALATGRHGELSGVIRLFWRGTFWFWLLAAVAALVFQRQILTAWKVENPMALYLTLPVVLLTLWMPMFWGVLQGQQNFLWLGWSMLSNGIGRLGVAAFAVLVLHAYAAGMLTGVLLGTALAFGIAAWQTRALWLCPPTAFDRRGLARQVIPLVLGFLGFQILFTADTMFVKTYFSEETAGFYVAAGTLSRALMWLVLPLAAVMFPRLVHSAARAEKTNLLGVVLVGTAVLAVAGVAGLVLLGPWVVRIPYPESFARVVIPLLPWYAGAMVPLAVANVLLNDLLARPASKLGLGLAILTVALAYMFCLTRLHSSPVQVLQVMGCFNLLLLAVCAAFRYARQSPHRTGLPPS